METPSDLRYTEDHEWIRMEGSTAVVGITDYAQGELGDIVFVELPEPGTTVERGAGFGTIEAVKTVADLYSPVSGKVTAVNETLGDAPETVNRSPYGDGWMVRIEPDDASQLETLMDAGAYRAHVGKED
jgi:glycine cleavage system H protein